jgi:hypothetical protein
MAASMGLYGCTRISNNIIGCPVLSLDSYDKGDPDSCVSFVQSELPFSLKAIKGPLSLLSTQRQLLVLPPPSFK